MISRKTQLAWMAVGGVLCLLTVLVSCKVREGNRVAASGEESNAPIVPVSSPDAAPLPPIKQAVAEAKDGEPPVAPTVAGMATTTAASAIIPAFLPGPPSGTIEVVGGSVGSPPSVPPMPPEKRHHIKPGDTFEALSKRFFGTKAYASAWRIYIAKNDTYADMVVKEGQPVVGKDILLPTQADLDAILKPASDSLIATGTPPAPPPPVTAITPAVRVEAPPPVASVVENRVPPSDQKPVAPPPSVSREPGEPPLAPNPGPVMHYHVRAGGEILADIARHALGSADRAGELVRLNPSLTLDQTLTAGTLVRLPADACVVPEEVETVKPLPALRPTKPDVTQPKVVLPLTGTYPCNLDEQHVLLMPKTIRDQLDSSETLLVSPGPDQCLWLTNQAHLDRLAARLEQSSAREVDIRTFKRLFFAQAEKATVNADGRVAISERLAQFAGLHQEVVLVGIDDHFELWDVARWKYYTQKKSAPARAVMAADQE